MIKTNCPIRDEIEVPDLTKTEHERLFPPHVPADPERWHRSRSSTALWEYAPKPTSTDPRGPD